MSYFQLKLMQIWIRSLHACGRKPTFESNCSLSNNLSNKVFISFCQEEKIEFEKQNQVFEPIIHVHVSDALSVLSVRPGIHLIPRVLLFCRESPGIMFSKLIRVLLEQVVLGFSCCCPVGAASVKVLSTSVIETILFPF